MKNINFYNVLSCLPIFNNDYFAFDVTDFNDFLTYSFIGPHPLHGLQMFYFISEFPFPFRCYFLCSENFSGFYLNAPLCLPFGCLCLCFHIQKIFAKKYWGFYHILCCLDCQLSLERVKYTEVILRSIIRKLFKRLMQFLKGFFF